MFLQSKFTKTSLRRALRAGEGSYGAPPDTLDWLSNCEAKQGTRQGKDKDKGRE